MSSPVRGATLPEQQQVSDRDIDELVRKLKKQAKAKQADQVAQASSPQRAKTQFMGDRGSLDGSFTGGSPGGQLPASAEVNIDPALATGELPRELEHREVELRVLRAEVETRTNQAGVLRSKVRDSEMALKRASNVVGTLSAKVEATAGSRHAVLEATTANIDSEVGMLRRRLAQKEFDLASKGEEIATLRRATDAGTRRVEEQRRILHTYQQKYAAEDSQVSMFNEHLGRLQRHRAIGDWHDRVHADLAQQDQADSLQSERLEREQEIHVLEEEMGTLNAFISRMDEKSRFHRKESVRVQEHYNTLVHEDRMCVTAAGLGRNSTTEHRKHLVQRAKALELRIKEEVARKAEKAEQARGYDAVESHARHYQSQLAALVTCTQEATRTLQNRHSGRVHTPTSGVEAQWPDTSYTPPLSMPLQIGSSPLLVA